MYLGFSVKTPSSTSALYYRGEDSSLVTLYLSTSKAWTTTMTVGMPIVHKQIRVRTLTMIPILYQSTIDRSRMSECL